MKAFIKEMAIKYIPYFTRREAEKVREESKREQKRIAEHIREQREDEQLSREMAADMNRDQILRQYANQIALMCMEEWWKHEPRVAEWHHNGWVEFNLAYSQENAKRQILYKKDVEHLTTLSNEDLTVLATSKKALLDTDYLVKEIRKELGKRVRYDTYQEYAERKFITKRELNV